MCDSSNVCEECDNNNLSSENVNRLDQNQDEIEREEMRNNDETQSNSG